MKTPTGKRPAAKAIKTELTVTAKLFQNGRSQAVRLPKEFRFEGDRVRIRRVKRGVLLEAGEEPQGFDVDAWLAKLDHYNKIAGPFMPEGPEGRNQGITRSRKIFD